MRPRTSPFGSTPADKEGGQCVNLVKVHSVPLKAMCCVWSGHWGWMCVVGSLGWMCVVGSLGVDVCSWVTGGNCVYG